MRTNNGTRSGRPTTVKSIKTGKKVPGNVRSKVRESSGQHKEADGWEDEDASSKSRSASRDSRNSRTSSVDTPTAEKSAYFGPGASSTDLSQRAPRRGNSLAALDLATHPELGPLVVPPVQFTRPDAQAPRVEKMVVRAGELKDGRLVDALGRSYFVRSFARATDISKGGMLLSFDEVQPQAYWAKRIEVPEGEGLPKSLRREVELNIRSGTPASVHRILRTSDAFYLLMPYMMGDTRRLFGNLDTLARDAGDPASVHDQVFDLKRIFAAQMLQSVAEAHAKGILHRDIKLENFAYHEQTASLIDFGSAHETRFKNARRPAVPGQLAPDHIFPEGALDHAKGDVYAAGVSVYTLLTGDNFLLPAVSAYLATLPPAVPGADPDLQVGDKSILNRVKADYAAAWPLMHEAAATLQQHADRLAGKYGPALSAEVDAIVNVPALAAKLAAFSHAWARYVPVLLRRDPLGSLAILNAVAPTDAQRSTAAEAAAAYGAAVEPTRASRQHDLGALTAKLSAPAVRAARAEASEIAAEVKARLHAPASHYDELQLENQPRVNSKAEAVDYIRNLSEEPAPNIPVIKDKAGNVKRLRELYVKLK